jgi:hypothetical protein
VVVTGIEVENPRPSGFWSRVRRNIGGRNWDRTSDPFHVKEVRYRCAIRPGLCYFEVETGFEPVVLQLCRLLLWAAQPLHRATALLRADDEIRTRDPNLGKVVLYQLSHIRMLHRDAT